MYVKSKHDKKYCYYLILNTMNWIIKNNATSSYIAPFKEVKAFILTLSYLSPKHPYEVGNGWLSLSPFCNMEKLRHKEVQSFA